ncbi:MAG: tetratricopeptide repeat protein, partial [Pseudomonadota bacterium]
VAFVLLQVGEITFDPLQLPEWSLRALIFVVVLAFPLVVVLAWVLELTPDGIKRELPGQGSRYSGVLMVVGVLLLDGALALYLYQFYAPGVMRDTSSLPAGVAARSAGAAGPISAAPTYLTPSQDALALLPFEDLSPEGDQAYFAAGVSEELADALTKVDGLRVVSGRAARSFATQNRTPREIGGLLGVGWLLNGSVRKAGDTLRVRVALSSTEDGFDKWSETFEGSLDNTLAIQDEIAEEVVQQVLGSTDTMAEAEGERSQIASFDAWDEYLGARADWRRRTPESLASAEQKFKATLEKDPDYAEAYSGLADTYLLQANYGNRTNVEAVALAEQNADVALRLNGNLASAFATLGLLNRMLGRYPQAEGYLKRALRLDPKSIDAANWLAGLLGSLGRLEEERLVLQEALEFNQFDELLNMAMADNELRRGAFDAGMERLNNLRSIYPDSSQLLRTLARWDVIIGRHTRAHGSLMQALSLSPNEPVTQTMLGHLYLRWGNLQRAEAAISRARELAPDNQEVEDAWARLLLAAGRFDELETFSQGRLERLTPQEQGSTSDTLQPLMWQGVVALGRGEPELAFTRFQSVVERLDILLPFQSVQVLSWSAAAGMMGDARDTALAQLDQANRLLERLRVQGNTSPELNYLEAVLLALGGREEPAVALLEETMANGFTSANEVGSDPRLAALRTSPRFDALLKSVSDQSRTDLASVMTQLAAVDRSSAGRRP